LFLPCFLVLFWKNSRTNLRLQAKGPLTHCDSTWQTRSPLAGDIARPIRPKPARLETTPLGIPTTERRVVRIRLTDREATTSAIELRREVADAIARVTEKARLARHEVIDFHVFHAEVRRSHGRLVSQALARLLAGPTTRRVARKVTVAHDALAVVEARLVGFRLTVDRRVADRSGATDNDEAEECNEEAVLRVRHGFNITHDGSEVKLLINFRYEVVSRLAGITKSSCLGTRLGCVWQKAPFVIDKRRPQLCDNTPKARGFDPCFPFVFFVP